MLFVLPAADMGYRIFLPENEADVRHTIADYLNELDDKCISALIFHQ